MALSFWLEKDDSCLSLQLLGHPSSCAGWRGATEALGSAGRGSVPVKARKGQAAPRKEGQPGAGCKEIHRTFLPSQPEKGPPMPRASVWGSRTLSRAWGLGVRAWLLGSLGQHQIHGGISGALGSTSPVEGISLLSPT